MSGSKMLAKAVWAVVGNQKNKVFGQVVTRLEQHNKKVFQVDPRDSSGSLATSLSQLPQKVEVIDLLVGPKNSAPVLEEAAKLGVKNVFLQPGSESPDVLALCKKLGMETHQGCVLMELK
eukprot:RCo002982